MPQPGSIASPVGDHEAHTVADIICHVVQVAAVSSHRLLSTILSHGGGESAEMAILLAEGDLGVEGLVSVDCVLVTRAISVPLKLIVDVLSALTALVAALVVTDVGWSVTLVGSGGP